MGELIARVLCARPTLSRGRLKHHDPRLQESAASQRLLLGFPKDRWCICKARLVAYHTGSQGTGIQIGQNMRSFGALERGHQPHAEQVCE